MKILFNTYQRNLIRNVCRKYVNELTSIFKSRNYNQALVLANNVEIIIPTRCIEETMAEELELFTAIRKDPDNLIALLNTKEKQSDFRHALFNYSNIIEHPEAHAIWKKLFLLEKLEQN